MTWNPWITIAQESDADPAARQLYRETRSAVTGKVSDLVKITSRTPKVARLIQELCEAVYSSATGLAVREKEIAALITSAKVGCVH